MTMSWLVTGAAGFIGANLCSYLRKQGYSVRGYDNFSTGTRANIDRIAELGSGEFIMIEGDIRDETSVQAAVSGCDVVVHLAAQVSVPKSIEDPINNDSINSAGFLSVLLSAGRGNVKRLIYASSCAVYGDNPASPLTEKDSPSPLSPYAASKLINEHYAQTLAFKFPSMPAIGLRFFNIFGPWQPFEGGYASVIPKWIQLMTEGKQPKIYGDGSATRDFCHIDNVCAAIHSVGSRPEPPSHPIYNICSGSPITIAELYAIIKDSLAQRGRNEIDKFPKHMPPRPGDILHSLGAFERAKADFNFKPIVGLRDGIGNILACQYGMRIE